MSGSDLVTEVIGGSLGEEDLALYRQIKISVIGRKLGRTISIRSEDCLDCESSSADWRYRIEPRTGGANMTHLLRKLCWHDEGQDIAEYAVMLAVILVIVVGTIRLVGSNANNVFSSAASSIQ